MGVMSFLLMASCGDKKPTTYDPFWEPPSKVDRNPSWSHDGSRVAFFSYQDSSRNRSRGIFITDSSGGSERIATGIYGWNARWMPGDSELIIGNIWIDASTNGLKKYNIRSSAVTSLVVDANKFDISPDGKYVYFDGTGSPGGDWVGAVFRLTIESGQIDTLFYGSFASVSPDGSKIAFCKQRVFVNSLLDSSTVTIATSRWPSYPTWTPDGKNVFYSGGDGWLYKASSEDGSTVRFVQGYGPSRVSPDGTRLLFTGIKPDDKYELRLWQINLDGTNLKQFTF